MIKIIIIHITSVVVAFIIPFLINKEFYFLSLVCLLSCVYCMYKATDKLAAFKRQCPGEKFN